ncbi:hypothetical protein L596_027292 [Steinernema carpocapsae]|uniref:Uncharacterized protein n=1 Tax=Steinernema carpocapsae TaxID=34508 RepID=A0A4U5M584_STECR|nr:hypothetical protein L596_027292 [Steinernema carpocapsae]
MIYRRRAPKLIARHTLEATFSSVSVMYDEDALDGLTSLFDVDSAFADQESSDDSSSSSAAPLEQLSQLFLSIKIPEVQVELRSRRSTLLGEMKEGDGIAFSNVNIADVRIEAIRNELYVTKANIGFGEIVLLDMFEAPNQVMLRAVTSKSNVGSSDCNALSLLILERNVSIMPRALPSQERRRIVDLIAFKVGCFP